jgi:glucokinase
MSVLGIDIGGTQIKAGIVSAAGEVLRSTRRDTPGSIGEFASAMRAVVTELQAEAVAGVGIGCKGIMHPTDTSVILSPGPIRYLDGHKLSQFVPQGIPVFADNDARVALAGEMVWGAARGRQNALMLTLGTGVGGGILAEGRMVRGAAGIAGHLGHYTVDPDGPLCICGNRGCLETYFSARSIESEAAAVLHRATPTFMTGTPSCREVFEHAAQGDRAASLIVKQAIQRLAGAVAGMFLMFDPELLIVGGQIASAGEALFAPLREDVWERTRPYLRREIPIVKSEVADSTGVLGAAALVLARPV